MLSMMNQQGTVYDPASDAAMRLMRRRNPGRQLQSTLQPKPSMPGMPYGRTGQGKVFIPEKLDKTIQPYGKGLIANHEMEHAYAQTNSIPKDVSEIAPVIGDLVFGAESFRRQEKKPLRGNISVGSKERPIEWMRQQAMQHGYFDGRSMQDLLQTPAGLSYLSQAARGEAPNPYIGTETMATNQPPFMNNLQTFFRGGSGPLRQGDDSVPMAMPGSYPLIQIPNASRPQQTYSGSVPSMPPADSRPQLPASPQPKPQPTRKLPTFGINPLKTPTSGAPSPTVPQMLPDVRAAQTAAADMAGIRAEVQSMTDFVNNPGPDPRVTQFYADLQEGYENMVPSNYRDMTERGEARRRAGIQDNFVMPRSAEQNLNSKMANMSPEEFNEYSFTSTQSGLKGRGSYGGRGNYSAEGSLAGRENALDAAGGLAPTTQMIADQRNANADARRRAGNKMAGRSGEDMGSRYGSGVRRDDSGNAKVQTDGDYVTNREGERIYQRGMGIGATVMTPGATNADGEPLAPRTMSNYARMRANMTDEQRKLNDEYQERRRARRERAQDIMTMRAQMANTTTGRQAFGMGGNGFSPQMQYATTYQYNRPSLGQAAAMLDASRRSQQVADRADEQQAFNNQLAVVTAMPEGPQRTQALSQLQAMMQPSSGEVQPVQPVQPNPNTRAGRDIIRQQEDEYTQYLDSLGDQGMDQSLDEIANPPEGVSSVQQLLDSGLRPSDLMDRMDSYQQRNPWDRQTSLMNLGVLQAIIDNPESSEEDKERAARLMNRKPPRPGSGTPQGIAPSMPGAAPSSYR
jgi:hypothetical protein